MTARHARSWVSLSSSFCSNLREFRTAAKLHHVSRRRRIPRPRGIQLPLGAVAAREAKGQDPGQRLTLRHAQQEYGHHGHLAGPRLARHLDTGQMSMPKCSMDRRFDRQSPLTSRWLKTAATKASLACRVQQMQTWPTWHWPYSAYAAQLAVAVRKDGFWVDTMARSQRPPRWLLRKGRERKTRPGMVRPHHVNMYVSKPCTLPRLL